ncbi:MAG: acyl-CoA thioester hydrolase, partial [Pseudonocardiales bacterium]|nr:acyl-CoA thioester hydrolase [Pseudonocardiales bacterium]
MTFTYPHQVRYLEVDAQKVVFNSWYLAWFDDAMTAYLKHGGLTYKAMLDAGYDVHVVRSEIDWRAGVGFQDTVEIAVATARLGRTSFALDFEVRLGGAVTCAGRSVYV